MNKVSTLRRHLIIIRQVRRPYLYPTKIRLLSVLAENGLSLIRARTIERDIQDIRNEYGITIAYNRYRKGYYLDLPTDEDVSDFEEYVRLLERRERMEFLTQPFDTTHTISRYLQLERSEPVWGTNLLPIIWEALQSHRVITFNYQAYTALASRFCRVEPGFLFEYHNRWYLDCWDLEVKKPDKMRTFGVDRIRDLRLTDQTIKNDRSSQYRVNRQHAIGVTCPPDLEPQRVVLRFTVQQGKYIVSLPLHNSQNVLPQTKSGFTDFELFVILNQELIMTVLSYGDTVEVLQPTALREIIAERVKMMAALYEH